MTTSSPSSSAATTTSRRSRATPMRKLLWAAFSLRAGEPVFLFFPGANLDPATYANPLQVDLERRFNAKNQLVFGGSAYTCIGKKAGNRVRSKMVAGFVEHLPDGVYVEEDRVEADGAWVTERIITRLPIEWD